MRNEKEVLDELLAFASGEDAIRAMLMNGSRVNPAAKQDLFCDYDILCAVKDPEAFVRSPEWIRRFGEPVMIQQNDCSQGEEKFFIFLMLFEDGIRIDLSFVQAKHLPLYLEDSLTRVLLDKDNQIPPLGPSNESSYFVRKPAREEFDSAVNNFWWCSTNAAKGLWRGELPYVKFMFDVIVREELCKLLCWSVGLQHDWKVNMGKAGRWLEKFLPPERWDAYRRTYVGGDSEAIWEAMEAAGALAREVGQELALALGYAYPMEDDRRVTAYLKRVRALSPDAVSFDT